MKNNKGLDAFLLNALYVTSALLLILMLLRMFVSH